jgi:LuxR family maltose regulon positive regulatory protein
LSAFPAHASETDGELALVLAAGHLYDDRLDESAAQIAAAGRLAAMIPAERRRAFDRRLASLELWLAAERGDLDGAQTAMQSLAIACHEAMPEDVTCTVDQRAFALMHRGVAELWTARWDDARRDLEEAIALSRRGGRAYLETRCLGYQALLGMLSGAPPADALRLCEEATSLAVAHGWDGDRALVPATVAAEAALAWLGRFDEAEHRLERTDDARPLCDPWSGLVLHSTRALVRLAQGRHDAALAELRAAERLRAKVGPAAPLAVRTHASLIAIQALAGDATGARAALDAAGPAVGDLAEMRIAGAALAIAEGEAQEAADILAPLVEGSPDSLTPCSVAIYALLLDAAAREELAEPAAAMASIERALTLAERDGLVLPFVVAPVRSLLERRARQRTTRSTLLSTILTTLAGRSPRFGDAPPPLREPLSEAELRVGRYLPGNLKAPEIASELLISTNTVRTHLRHIYAKLGAHTRGEAVARARELGLLAPGSREHR